MRLIGIFLPCLLLIEGFDLKEDKRKIFPVDQLTNVKQYSPEKRINEKKIEEKLRKQEEDINFVLELGPMAIAQFKKYHPLKFTLSYIGPYQTTAILKTCVDVHHSEEVTELAKWLLFLGDDIKVREMPREVLVYLQERLSIYI